MTDLKANDDFGMNQEHALVETCARRCILRLCPRERRYLPRVVSQAFLLPGAEVDHLLQPVPADHAARLSPWAWWRKLKRPARWGLHFADHNLLSPHIVLIVRALVRDMIRTGQRPSENELRDAIHCAGNALNAPSTIISELVRWLPRDLWESLDHELRTAPNLTENSRPSPRRRGEWWVKSWMPQEPKGQFIRWMSRGETEKHLIKNQHRYDLILHVPQQRIIIVSAKGRRSALIALSELPPRCQRLLELTLAAAEHGCLPYQAVFSEALQRAETLGTSPPVAIRRVKLDLLTRLGRTLPDLLIPEKGQDRFRIDPGLRYCWIRGEEPVASRPSAVP